MDNEFPASFDLEGDVAVVDGVVDPVIIDFFLGERVLDEILAAEEVVVVVVVVEEDDETLVLRTRRTLSMLSVLTVVSSSKLEVPRRRLRMLEVDILPPRLFLAGVGSGKVSSSFSRFSSTLPLAIPSASSTPSALTSASSSTALSNGCP